MRPKREADLLLAKNFEFYHEVSESFEEWMQKSNRSNGDGLGRLGQEAGDQFKGHVPIKRRNDDV